MSLKLIHDALLRGTACVIWMASFVLALFEIAEAQTNAAFLKSFEYGVIGFAAVAAHSYLIGKKISEEEHHE